MWRRSIYKSTYYALSKRLLTRKDSYATESAIRRSFRLEFRHSLQQSPRQSFGLTNAKYKSCGEDENYNSYHGGYTRFYRLAPAAIAAKKKASDKEEEDKEDGNEQTKKIKYERKHIHGEYTFTQHDITEICRYVESKGQSRRVYPEYTTNNSTLRNRFRSFVEGKQWNIQTKVAHNITKKLLFKVDEKVFDKTSGKLICKTKYNPSNPTHTMRRKQVRVLPERALAELWNKFHVNAGHPGQNAMIKNINRTYYIDKVVQFVNDNLSQCEFCMKQHNNNKKYYRGPLQIHKTPKQALSEFSIDLFKAPVCTNAKDGEYDKYGLVVKCLVTRIIRIFGIVSKEAAVVAQELHEGVTLHYGGVTRYHSDNGLEFVNQLDNNLHEMYNYEHSTIIPGCPWQNPAESGVKVVKSKLRSLLAEQSKMYGHVFDLNKWPTTWSLLIPEAEYLINSSTNTITNISPFEYAYNKRIRGTYTPNEDDIPPNIDLNDNTNSHDKNHNKKSNRALLNPQQLVAAHKARYSAMDVIGRSTIDRKRDQRKQQWDNKFETERISIGTKVKWRERGHWLPNEGALLVSSYTRTGKAKLVDNMQNHIITMPLSELKPALKRERVTTMSQSTIATRYQKENASYVNNPRKHKQQSDEHKTHDNNIEHVFKAMSVSPNNDQVSMEIDLNTKRRKNQRVRTSNQMTASANDIENMDGSNYNNHGLKRTKINSNQSYVTKVKHKKQKSKVKRTYARKRASPQ
eukprot:921681_1